jgi:serine protease inhibitor
MNMKVLLFLSLTYLSLCQFDNLQFLDGGDKPTKDSFQISIFKKVAKGKNDNILISPISISLALSLTANGAVGETQEEMVQVLKPDHPHIASINEECKDLVEHYQKNNKDAKLHIANAIFSRVMSTKQFEQDAINYFDARAEELIDAEQVNKWVEGKTNDKIKGMIKEIDPDVVALLISAVYFKSEWAVGFDKLPRQAPFKMEDGNVVKTDFFDKRGFTCQYYEADGVKAVALPLKDGYEFVVVMPDSNINGFIESLSQQKLNTILGGLKDEYINFQMPEFKFETSQELISLLQDLGINKAFTSSANFSQLSTEDSVYINGIKHNTFINVNHEGIEAAAVTVLSMGMTSMELMPKINLVVDRPFLFAIRHAEKKEDLIFLGKVEKLK